MDGMPEPNAGVVTRTQRVDRACDGEHSAMRTGAHWQTKEEVARKEHARCALYERSYWVVCEADDCLERQR